MLIGFIDFGLLTLSELLGRCLWVCADNDVLPTTAVGIFIFAADRQASLYTENIDLHLSLKMSISVLGETLGSSQTLGEQPNGLDNVSNSINACRESFHCICFLMQITLKIYKKITLCL